MISPLISQSGGCRKVSLIQNQNQNQNQAQEQEDKSIRLIYIHILKQINTHVYVA